MDWETEDFDSVVYPFAELEYLLDIYDWELEVFASAHLNFGRLYFRFCCILFL